MKSTFKLFCIKKRYSHACLLAYSFTLAHPACHAPIRDDHPIPLGALFLYTVAWVVFLEIYLANVFIKSHQIKLCNWSWHCSIDKGRPASMWSQIEHINLWSCIHIFLLVELRYIEYKKCASINYICRHHKLPKFQVVCMKRSVTINPSKLLLYTKPNSLSLLTAPTHAHTHTTPENASPLAHMSVSLSIRAFATPLLWSYSEFTQLQNAGSTTVEMGRCEQVRRVNKATHDVPPHMERISCSFRPVGLHSGMLGARKNTRHLDLSDRFAVLYNMCIYVFSVCRV